MQALRERGEELRQALPFQTTTAYAYSPRENATSDGRHHLIVQEPLSVGLLKRQSGDPLCKPAGKFWGLVEFGRHPATCLTCLEIAERLAK